MKLLIAIFICMCLCIAFGMLFGELYKIMVKRQQKELEKCDSELVYYYNSH